MKTIKKATEQTIKIDIKTYKKLKQYSKDLGMYMKSLVDFSIEKYYREAIKEKDHIKRCSKCGFGTFDLNRKLTEYELENFEEFMKDDNTTNINAKDIDLASAYKEIKKHLFD